MLASDGKQFVFVKAVAGEREPAGTSADGVRAVVFDDDEGVGVVRRIEARRRPAAG